MALPGHAADQLLVALEAVPQKKEGGGYLPQGQFVQEAARGGRPWPVVKGEGHHRHLRLSSYLHFCAAGGHMVLRQLWSGRKGQSEAQHQQGPADPGRTMIPQRTHLVFHKIAHPGAVSRPGSRGAEQTDRVCVSYPSVYGVGRFFCGEISVNFGSDTGPEAPASRVPPGGRRSPGHGPSHPKWPGSGCAGCPVPPP